MAAPFYAFQRQVGTVNQIVPVYVQDLSNSSFPGLANVFASTVSASWFRSDATGATSFAIISTAALGTYSSGNWTQVNSTFAKGWYELGVPSATFSSGHWAVVHVYAATTSTTTFSHAPIFIELTKFDNQTYVSSQTLSTAICRIYSDGFVTTAAGILSVGAVGVSSFGLAVGVSSINTALSVGVSSFSSRVGVSSFNLDVGVSSMNTGLQVGVSSFNSRVGVSSFNLDVGVSSMNTGLSVNVTTFNSRVGVSSFNSPVGVSSFNVGLQVGVSTFGIDVGVSSINTGVQVGVSSFSSRVGVSSFGIAVGVSSVTDKTGYGVSTVTGLDTSLIDASISSRLSAAGYTAPDNTGIGAIKVQTDRLTYTVANQVDANIQYVNNVQVIGTGTSSDTWGPA